MTESELGQLSRHQTELLAWLYLHLLQEFALVELAVDVGMPTSVAGEELRPLVAAGLVSRRTSEAGDAYQADTTHDAAGELMRYFATSRGPARVVAEEFAALEEAELVVLFGGWAGGSSGGQPAAPRDVDLLVVGSASAIAVAAAAERAEQRLDLPVNTIERTSEQWALGADPVVAELQRSAHVIVSRAPRLLRTSDGGPSASIAT